MLQHAHVHAFYVHFVSFVPTLVQTAIQSFSQVIEKENGEITP